MIEDDIIEIMIALPGQLFLNTGIPCCLWFLTNDKTKNGRDRRKETLFIDVRTFGNMETRSMKVLSENDINKIKDTVNSWRKGEFYKDIEGFCKSSTIEEIKKNEFTLSPGKYVGLANENENLDQFNKDLSKLIDQLNSLNDQSNFLNEEIKINLKKINPDV
jgi:type I restriction enzyme M protein